MPASVDQEKVKTDFLTKTGRKPNKPSSFIGRLFGRGNGAAEELEDSDDESDESEAAANRPRTGSDPPRHRTDSPEPVDGDLRIRVLLCFHSPSMYASKNVPMMHIYFICV